MYIYVSTQKLMAQAHLE